MKRKKLQYGHDNNVIYWNVKMTVLVYYINITLGYNVF